jgi:hypothetical protein
MESILKKVIGEGHRDYKVTLQAWMSFTELWDECCTRMPDQTEATRCAKALKVRTLAEKHLKDFLEVGKNADASIYLHGSVHHLPNFFKSGDVAKWATHGLESLHVQRNRDIRRTNKKNSTRLGRTGQTAASECARRVMRNNTKWRYRERNQSQAQKDKRAKALKEMLVQKRS